MPDVHAKTLASVPLPPHRVAQWFEDMCAALQQAHADNYPLSTTHITFRAPTDGRSTFMLLDGPEGSKVISEKQHRFDTETCAGSLLVHVTTTRLTLEDGALVVRQREMRQDASSEGEPSSRSTGDVDFTVLEDPARAHEIGRMTLAIYNTAERPPVQ